MNRAVGWVSLLVLAASMGLCLPASAAVDKYETHDCTVLSSSWVEHRFVKVLSPWTFGGPYGGTTTYQYGISNSCTVSASCSWDFSTVVSASIGMTIGRTVSRTGGCQFPVPPNEYGRCIQEAYGYSQSLRVTHYVWQNLQESVPSGDEPLSDEIIAVPCATLIEIYYTYPTAWCPSGTNYAPQYTTTPY